MTFAHLDQCNVTKLMRLNEHKYLVIMQVNIQHANKQTIEAITTSWECSNYNVEYTNWALYTRLTLVISDHTAMRYRLTC